MNQAELRTLTEERLRDAKALLDGGRWSFAYSTAGYAVECALKSCVLARMVHTGWVFQDKASIKECLTHDFQSLVQLAGLQPERYARLAANVTFASRWATVAGWQVSSRYAVSTQAAAEELYEAITHDPDGVLLWLPNYW